MYFVFVKKKNQQNSNFPGPSGRISVLRMRSFSGTVDSGESHRGGGISLGAEWSSSTPFTSKEEAGSKMKVIFPQTASYSDVFYYKEITLKLKQNQVPFLPDPNIVHSCLFNRRALPNKAFM